MKANSVTNITNFSQVHPIIPNFRSERVVSNLPIEKDEFVSRKKTKSNNTAWWIAGGLILAGAIGLFLHKSHGVKKHDTIVFEEKFKTLGDAKKFFEKLGIEADFCGANDNHIDLLNRIKELVFFAITKHLCPLF